MTEVTGVFTWASVSRELAPETPHDRIREEVGVERARWSAARKCDLDRPGAAVPRHANTRSYAAQRAWCLAST